MKAYDQMLEELYKQLPEKAKEKSRFKMPVFESFIEGANTIISNFAQVVSDLRRPPEHLMKYLSKECATAINFDGSRALLKGKFRDKILNDKLTAYAKEYVLCRECEKPDTNLIMQEGQQFIRCEACGARHPVALIK
jgi:translation initiation factor 2 subunit 2